MGPVDSMLEDQALSRSPAHAPDSRGGAVRPTPGDPPLTLSAGRPPRYLGYLLLISLLFMLNVTLFFTLNTGMDLYGFYTLDPVSAYPLPLVLSTLLNLGLALAGYALYRWLSRRQGWFQGRTWGPFTRGAVLAGAPVLLAYGPSIVLTSHGGKPSLIVVAGLMAGALCVTHALRDRDMRLDSMLARYWFIGAISVILVFLALSIGGMLVLYSADQFPVSGNLLWDYEYRWVDLGYPREEFPQRQRDALVGFTLTGSGFMIVALAGSMLGAILRWTRAPAQVSRHPPPSRRPQDAPPWVARVAEKLGGLDPSAPGEGEYVAVFSGHEIEITGSQYERLIADRDGLLQDVELLVDKVSGGVFLRAEGAWIRLDFRIKGRSAGIRSGPFSLLCLYARYPGRRFTNGELRTLLEQEMVPRLALNVGDFIGQLLRRTPPLPVERDSDGSYIPESARVCLLAPPPRSRSYSESRTDGLTAS